MNRFWFEFIRMKNLLFLFYFLFISSYSMSQIGSPALGKNNTGSWLAFGINQKLDTLNKWSSMSYIGLGRKSNLNSYNPVRDPGIFIINEEVNHRFHKHWEYSLALSYRRQNLYESISPYEKSNPSSKQEFRFYGKVSYLVKTNFVEITPTFRQEVRKFYTPDFKNYSETLQLRTRFRLKFTFLLTDNKIHRLLLYSEQLFSTSLRTNPKEWTKFKYKDSRFSLYYSFSPKSIPFQFDLGYMHNLVGTQSNFSAHYFAFDIIWKNPFKL